MTPNPLLRPSLKLDIPVCCDGTVPWYLLFVHFRRNRQSLDLLTPFQKMEK